MAGTDKSRIEVRKNTFTNWCNHHLKGSGTEIDDLRTELYDGVKLISLLKQLSGKDVRGPQDKKNLSTAIDLLKQEKIPIYIGGRDIAERNLELILSLVWTLIVKYQILGGGGETNEDAEKPFRPAAKNLLLHWLQVSMPEAQPVGNLTSDWNNGLLLSALVNMKKPGSIPNFRSLRPKDALVNTKRAMHIAESECGIPKIIEAEHMCMEKPDELSVMTYLSCFCCGDDSPGYKNLLAWVRMKIPSEYDIQNFTTDWRDGRALSALVNTVAEGSIPNHNYMDSNNGVENVRTAMETANVKLEEMKKANQKMEEPGEIMVNITPEEFADESTCPFVVMCYIEGLRKAKLLSTSGQGHHKQGTKYGAVAESTVNFAKNTSKEIWKCGGQVWSRFRKATTSSLKPVLIELRNASLITNAEKRSLSDIKDLATLQSTKNPEVVGRTAGIMKAHGFAEESRFLSALAELLQVDLITTKEAMGLKDPSDVVRVQSTKAPEVMDATAGFLQRKDFVDELDLLKVLVALRKADLITSEECMSEAGKDGMGVGHASDVVRIQSAHNKSHEVMVKTADILMGQGFEEESEFLSVLAELRQAKLISAQECAVLTDFIELVRVQSDKSPELMAKTEDALRKCGLEKEFIATSVRVLLAVLQDAGLTTDDEKEILKDASDVVRVQRVKSSAVMALSADILNRFGFVEESQFLFVLAELGQADLITNHDRERLSDPSAIVSVQCGKSSQELALTADVLSKFHRFKEESRFIAVLSELLQAHLITTEECKVLHDLGDVLRVLSSKPDAKDILKRHGLEDESKLNSVIAELGQADLDPSAGCRMLLDPTCLVEVLCRKSPEVVTRVEYILRRYGFKFDTEFRVLAAIFDLRKADLMTSKDCMGLSDLSDVVKVQSKKPQRMLNKCAEIMKKHGFKEASVFLADANFLTRRPTMDEVSKLVVPKLPSQWKPMGIHLGFTHERLQTFERYLRKEMCCNEMFKVWLQDAPDPGAGSKQRTWDLVLSAMEEQDSLAAQEIREALRTNVAQAGIEGATATNQPQDLDIDELTFEERYAEVVRNQASVTLKITKCTTIGPPRKGKTCLKYLLAGVKWDVEEGTASTDVMEAPEWVECYSEGQEGAKDLWKLISEEEQQRKVIRAVITVPTDTPPSRVHSTSGAGAPTAKPIDVTSATPLNGTSHLPTDSGFPPTITSGNLLTTTPGHAQPTTTPGDDLPTANPSDTRITTEPRHLPSTAKHSGSLHQATSTYTSTSDLKAGTLVQGVQALASAFRSKPLKDFLKDKGGKVLGETQLIHFIDTGGQVIYHDVHPILITSSSVYLVVFSLKDFHKMPDEEQLKYFKSDLIQRPLESICAFGTKTPQAKKDHIEFHPEVPKIFIVGTHRDHLDKELPGTSCKQFLSKLHRMISSEIGSKPYRQFVQYDPQRRSFWAVDNTQAGREDDEDDKKYITALRKKVQHKSMEMSVRVPLPWMLLKVVMDGDGKHVCKYSDLLKEAQIRGYVREKSASEDLDTMLKLFHILSLFYHNVPTGCEREDSLVFINPDCLFSATSDFLMAAREDIREDLQYTQEAGHVDEEQKLEIRRGIVDKNVIIQRMRDNGERIQHEVTMVLQKVEEAMANLDQGPTEEVLQLLCKELEETGQRYIPEESPESRDASTVKAKRELFIGRQIQSLVNTVNVVRRDPKRKGDVHHIREEVDRTVKKINACCRRRWEGSVHMDQVLLILSDLRIVAPMKESDGLYVVPAAFPKVTQSKEIPGDTASIFVTVLSQTIMEVCYLPSSLYCCLINDLVTESSWTVFPLGRTHFAFTLEGLTGFGERVHLIEHKSYIEVKLESEASLEELSQSSQLQRIKDSIYKSIVHVYNNVYRGSTAYTMSKKSLVWGFQCQEHPNDDTHIAVFREEDGDYWAECLLSSDEQGVEPEQEVWFSRELGLDQ